MNYIIIFASIYAIIYLFNALSNPLKMVQLRAPKLLISLSGRLYAHKRGMNRLMIAAFKNDFAKVDKYLKSGYNINEQDKLGGTALMCVLTRSNPLDMVCHLLSKGANPNLLDNKGRNALLLAIFNNQNYETIKELIEKGTDVHIADKDKNTALHYELSKPSPDFNIVKLLISEGIDVTAKNTANDTASLLCVCNNINSEITLSVLRASNPDSKIDILQEACSKFIISVKNGMLNGFLVRYYIDYISFGTEVLVGYIAYENNQRVFARLYTHRDNQIENSIMGFYENGELLYVGTEKSGLHALAEQSPQIKKQIENTFTSSLINFINNDGEEINIEDILKNMIKPTL